MSLRSERQVGRLQREDLARGGSEALRDRERRIGGAKETGEPVSLGESRLPEEEKRGTEEGAGKKICREADETEKAVAMVTGPEAGIGI